MQLLVRESNLYLRQRRAARIIKRFLRFAAYKLRMARIVDQVRAIEDQSSEAARAARREALVEFIQVVRSFFCLFFVPFVQYFVA